jgi:hypothetical protein
MASKLKQEIGDGMKVVAVGLIVMSLCLLGFIFLFGTFGV